MKREGEKVRDLWFNDLLPEWPHEARAIPGTSQDPRASSRSPIHMQGYQGLELSPVTFPGCNQGAAPEEEQLGLNRRLYGILVLQAVA